MAEMTARRRKDPRSLASMAQTHGVREGSRPVGL